MSAQAKPACDVLTDQRTRRLVRLLLQIAARRQKAQEGRKAG